MLQSLLLALKSRLTSLSYTDNDPHPHTLAGATFFISALTVWLISKDPRNIRTTSNASQHVSIDAEEAKVPPIKLKRQLRPALPLRPTPIDPVTPGDNRIAVRDLFVKHSADISALRNKVSSSPLFRAEIHDDLFLLRFVLSHSSKKGNIDAAAMAATATMKYRWDRGLDDADKDALSNDFVDKFANRPGVEKGALITYHPDDDREPFLLIDMARVDMHRLVKEMTYEEGLAAFMETSERNFQICDRVTRRTGRLTKQVRLVDVRKFELRMINREQLKRDAAMSNEFEDYYPQVLAKVFIVNPATWIMMTWRALKLLFPARFVEKVDLISPAQNSKDAQLLRRFISNENLPERFGGKKKEH